MHDWQKKMSEFQRQHPVAALSSALGLIRGNLITILVFLVVGARSEEFPFLLWIGGGFAFLLILGIATWWRFLYRVNEGELQIKRGVFVRKNLYLTKDRIQVIDITSGVIQRLFGLVKLDIQTAGASSREAAIEAITLSKAKEISRLLRPGNGDLHPENAEHQESVYPSSRETVKKIKLPGKELLIAASTSGSFGIALSILATLFSQIEPIITDSGLFEQAIHLLPQTDVLVVIYILVIFVIIAWLLSFFSTLFSYGDFQLEVKEEELVISRGIFEKKRITVPFNRIQAVHVAEGLIRQPLGYASLHLESAGYGDDKGTGSIVLFPLIHRSQILTLLDDVLPDYKKYLEGIRPPVRSLRRYILRSAFLITAASAALYWLLDLDEWIWLLPLLSFYWGWLKYKDAAIGWVEDGLTLRSRILSKSTAYIKKNRIQDVSLSESWFQRRRDLCSVRVYVASGDQGKSFSVRDLDKEDGYRLIRELKYRAFGLTERTEDPGSGYGKKINLPGWPQAVK